MRILEGGEGGGGVSLTEMTVCRAQFQFEALGVLGLFYEIPALIILIARIEWILTFLSTWPKQCCTNTCGGAVIDQPSMVYLLGTLGGKFVVIRNRAFRQLPIDIISFAECRVFF